MRFLKFIEEPILCKSQVTQSARQTTLLDVYPCDAVTRKVFLQSHCLATHLKQPKHSIITVFLLGGFEGATSSFELALRLYETRISLATLSFSIMLLGDCTLH